MIIERVLDLLTERNIQAKTLCDYLEINNSVMTNWKKRKTDPPARYIVPICEFFDVSLEYLLTGNESPEVKTNEEHEDNRYDLTNDEREWINMIRDLPDLARAEFKGELKGYLKALNSGVVVNEKTGTDNLGK